jgi:midasin
VPSFSAVSKALRRFRQIQSSPRILASGEKAREALVQAKNIICELESAAEELIHEVEMLDQTKLAFQVPSVFLQDAKLRLTALATLRHRIKASIDDSNGTKFCVVLEGWLLLRHFTSLICSADEMLALQDCRKVVTAWLDVCVQWQQNAPQLTPWISSVHAWLCNQAEVTLESSPPHGFSSDFSEITDSILVSVQKVLSLCSETSPPMVTEKTDDWMKLGSRQICAMTSAFSISVIQNKLEMVLKSLVAASESEISAQIDTILPFLDRYLHVVLAQLQAHSDWSTGLLRFTCVIGSILRTLAGQGFCKPPEIEGNGGEGDTLEETGGTGLGAGAGAEDISKEIEDESQVEGLKGDNTAEKEERGEKPAGADAVEMNEDFGGDLEDVEEDEEGVDQESGDEAEDDIEEKMENLDASDPSAVDERLWGDEQKSDAKDSDSKTQDNQNKDRSGESEMAAKEQERNQQNLPDDGEEAEDKQGQENEEVDMPEDTEGPADGAPVDEHVQEAETLNLPDDINMDAEKEDDSLDVDLSDDGMSIDDRGEQAENGLGDSDAQPDSPEIGHEMEPDAADDIGEATAAEDLTEDQADDDHLDEGLAATKADLKPGDGETDEGQASYIDQPSSAVPPGGDQVGAEESLNGKEGNVTEDLDER